MKITLLQRDICWADPQANCERLEQCLHNLPESDLYVFPEMFSTGFCTDPDGIAEDLSQPGSLDWMKKIAGVRNCALAGSLAVKENGNFYNRFYFVCPDGSTFYYDKKHLFTYGGEHKAFTAGQQRVIVTYKKVRILLQVCYDLRFPVWTRNRKDYDLILYVASWPTSRIDAWTSLLCARAIENQCYVAGVNRVGTDPTCSYCGGTVMFNPYGQISRACKRDAEDEVTVEIDLEDLVRFREKFPVLEDADSFELI